MAVALILPDDIAQTLLEWMDELRPEMHAKSTDIGAVTPGDRVAYGERYRVASEVMRQLQEAR